MKFLKYTEYLYLLVAVISFYNIFDSWNIDRDRSYMFIFFAAVSTGMFLFRRTYRKKFEQRTRDNQN